MRTLNWIGKDAVVNHHKEVPFRLLKCNEKLSVGDDSGYWFGQSDGETVDETPHPEQIVTPSLQTTRFSIPVLAVDMGDFLEQFDDSCLDEASLNLAKQDPIFPKKTFPKMLRSVNLLMTVSLWSNTKASTAGVTTTRKRSVIWGMYGKQRVPVNVCL